MRTIHRLFAAALLATVAASAAPAQRQRFNFDGTDAARSIGFYVPDQTGESVAIIRDVDGDLHDDIVIGEPARSVNGVDAGGARVHSGRTGEVLLRWEGDASMDAFGTSVADAGDVDGDGVHDVIAGAPGTSMAPGSGYARVFSGADGSVIRTIPAPMGASAAGVSVDGLGDLDGDGFGEVVVGAPISAAGGVAFVVAGSSGATLFSFPATLPTELMGFAVCSAGDVDGDGTDDIGVGTRADVFRIYSGSDGSLLLEVFGTVGSGFGLSLDAAGDVNRDGFGDIVVGAPLAGMSSGRVSVLSGVGGQLLFSVGGDPGDALGISVAGLGDFTGDGIPDVVAGGSGDTLTSDRPGLALVVSGAGGTVVARVDGDDVGDLFGLAVGGGGDADLDGRADFVVGAPAASASHPDEPSYARLFASARLSTPALRLRVQQPTNDDSRFGHEIAVLTDITGDGVRDLAVAAPGDVAGGNEVRILSGSDGSLVRTLTTSSTITRFGEVMEVMPDMDGDGHADLLVGEPDFVQTVKLFSGLTGAQLLAVSRPMAPGFGSTLANAGDVDGDGVADFVVGAPVVSEAYVLSGADGSVIHMVTGSESGFGRSVEGLGDVDGDGVPDFAVGRRKATTAATVRAYSGADASVLWTQTSTLPSFGHALETVPDIDGDGVADLACAAPGDVGSRATPAAPTGAVAVLSGATGVELMRLEGDSPIENFGESIASAGDVDRDGVPDLLVGCPYERSDGDFGGEVRVISGAGGGLIFSVHGTRRTFFGRGLAAADLDGDGTIEVLAGASSLVVPSYPTGEPPYVEIYSSIGAINPHPGSGEDLELISSIAGAQPLAGGVRAVQAGDLLELTLTSPAGTFTGAPIVLMAQLFPTPAAPAPIPGFPSLQINPDQRLSDPRYGPVVNLLQGGGLLGPGLLPPVPLNLAFVMPPALGGQSVMIQLLGVSAAARNGFFATSPGHAIVF